ncbi:hypothetical protein D9M68_327970 [compost metagenome]
MLEWILLIGTASGDPYAEPVARYETEEECWKAAWTIARQAARTELLEEGITSTDPHTLMDRTIAATPVGTCKRAKS